MIGRILLMVLAIPVVTFLGGSGLAFKIIGVVFPIITIIEVTTRGVTHSIQRHISKDLEFGINLLFWDVPRFLWIPAAIIFGVLLFLLAGWFHRLLLLYLNLLKSEKFGEKYNELF